jgi:hypothetical protein
MPNFTAGTSFTDGVTNDVTAAKLNALIADAVPTSSLALTSTNGTISNFTSSTATITGAITGSTNVINIGSGQIYKDASGLVGIGTTSPDALLDVKRVNTDGLIAEFGSGDLSGDVVLEIKSSDTRASINIGANGGTGDASRNLAFSTSGTERLRIDASGNVGVGTASPAGKLHVNGQTYIQGTVSGGLANSTLIANSSGQAQIWALGPNASTVGSMTFVVGRSDLSNSNQAITIDSSGKVGIGTTSPARLLTIESATNPEIGLYNSGTERVKFSTGGSAGSQLAIDIGGAEAMRIDSSRNVGIGTATLANYRFSIAGDSASQAVGIRLVDGNASGRTYSLRSDAGSFAIQDITGAADRLRIDSSGNVLAAKTSANTSDNGVVINNTGRFWVTTTDVDEVCLFNRQGTDGKIVRFFGQNTEEGDISVSGTTVSYNGGHLARWSQLPSGQRDPAIKKGTVLSNLDAMCEWRDADGNLLANEQLNKVKISDVEGDLNTAGVFVNWDDDDQDNPYDLNMAMTGDMIIRIAQETSVNRGDLLMSAGDGTAKPQGDDIIRSNTIAKVTSTNVTFTYEDGSYCVPCVLMAC